MKKFIINKNKKISDAIKLINKNGSKSCIVVDDKNQLFGSLTDGDIRRKVLKQSKNLNKKINNYCNKKVIFFYKNKYKNKTVKNLFLKKNLELIPILDKQKKILRILRRSQFLKNSKINFINKNSLKKTDIVIMAGGKGKRLDPITKIFPKPLVPIKNKTALENIMESFLKYGAKKFYFILNYKADLIKAYFKNKENFGNIINYINETTPLGTAGGLQKLAGRLSKNIIVSNCDVFFNVDFGSLIKHHIKYKNNLTVVTATQNSILPYGICEIDRDNQLIKIIEKPKFKNLVTTGLYVLDRSILKLIKKNKYLDMNDLIETSKRSKKKVGVFKISQGSWTDIGQLNEYKKNNHILSV